MKKITITLLLIAPLALSAQYFKSNYIGKYGCEVFQRNGSQAAHSLGYGSADVSYIQDNSFQIMLTDKFGGVLRKYTMDTDSTFADTVYVNNYEGKFYANDSLFVYDNHLNPVTDYYFCKKGTVGIIELKTIGFVVSPNPTRDVVKLIGNEKIKSVQVYDNTGRLLFNLKDASQELSINMSSYNAGIYCIAIETNSKHELFRVVKE